MKNVQLSPRLRFREFTEPWNKSKLGHLVHIQSGETPSKFKILTAGRYPFIKVDDLNNSERVQLTGRAYINESKSPIPKDSIIFPKRGGAIMTNKVRIAGCEMQMDTNMMALYPIDDSIKSDFLYYLISKANLSKIADTSSIPQINNKHIEPYRVAIPIPKEQQKIASFLTSVDTKIQQLTKKKALLEQYKKGVMKKIFKQEIRFKDEKGRDYPEWERKKLGAVSTILKGKGISKSDIVEGGNLECIRYGELYTHYGQRVDRVISRTNVDKGQLILSEENDVIMPSSGETQIDIARASCILRPGIAVGGDLNIIRSQQNGLFLAYYLTGHLNRVIAKLAQGNSVVHLYPRQLERLILRLPCVEEQSKIGGFLGSIDDKLQFIDAQILEVKNFKNGLLQQMFV